MFELRIIKVTVISPEWLGKHCQYYTAQNKCQSWDSLEEIDMSAAAVVQLIKTRSPLNIGADLVPRQWSHSICARRPRCSGKRGSSQTRARAWTHTFAGRCAAHQQREREREPLLAVEQLAGFDVRAVRRRNRNHGQMRKRVHTHTHTHRERLRVQAGKGVQCARLQGIAETRWDAGRETEGGRRDRGFIYRALELVLY